MLAVVFFFSEYFSYWWCQKYGLLVSIVSESHNIGTGLLPIDIDLHHKMHGQSMDKILLTWHI